MLKKFVAFILSLALFICIDSGSSAVTEDGISRVRLGKENGILDENIKVTIVDADDEGNPTFRQWTPSVSDIEEAENAYGGDESTATEEINGGIYEKPVLHSEEHYRFGKKNIEKDYIDIGRNLTYSKKCHINARVKAVVELVLICDKEFTDYFKNNYKDILNYWVVYMWDVNMRFKSLPSNDISFQVNEILVINSTDAQPFVENARSSVGTTLQKMLGLFSKWVYEQRDQLPTHDLIALVTNSSIDCSDPTQTCAAGQAWVSGPCSKMDHERNKSLQTAVFYDRGYWDSVDTATHEFGHSLGAFHDFDKKSNCTEKGYLMDYGLQKELQYFFSSCSDRMISNFVRSDQASCLRTLSSSKPRLDPSFDDPKAPSLDDQCKRQANNPQAWATPKKDDKPDNCTRKVCWRYPGGNGFDFTPVDNTDCGKGDGRRCFRGVCRQPAQFFKNVGSGLCIQASNPFSHAAPFVMVECTLPGTPLDKLFVKQEISGAMLLSPFQKGTEVGERCGYAGDAEGDTIKTDRCDVNNKQQGWDFKDVGNKQFLLKHVASGKCAKPESNNVGSNIGTYKTCDSKDNNIKWERF